MRTNLTPAAIRTAAASKQRVEMNDPATPGLNLRVAPSGRATWTWMGRDADGRVRRFGLGHNPSIGIAEARRKARKLAEEVRAGADPVRDARTRRKRARTQAHCNTLATLLALYGRQQGARVKSWANQMEPQIKRVFRPHLETPLGDLTVGALQLTVDDHPKPKSASFGVRCLMTVLRWAAAAGRQYVARDLLDLKASAAKPRRDRVLSRDELARVLPALRADVSPCATGLKLILLTACRRSEASAARWRDVDPAAGTWTLPTTKNGTEHVIPLSRQAIDLLRPLRPIDADPAALVFASRAGKADWAAATERVQAATGTADWHRHDLRRTAATMMGSLGTIPDIVEAALIMRRFIHLWPPHTTRRGIYPKLRQRCSCWRTTTMGSNSALPRLSRCAGRQAHDVRTTAGGCAGPDRDECSHVGAAAFGCRLDGHSGG
jgi:integrase